MYVYSGRCLYRNAETYIFVVKNLKHQKSDAFLREIIVLFFDMHQMTFYELIFFAAILNEAFRSPDSKTFFFCFILGCPQDFNFARLFRPFSPVSTQPYQNGRAKGKSCGHSRIKLNKCFVVGRPKSFIENCRKKNRFIKRHLVIIRILYN